MKRLIAFLCVMTLAFGCVCPAGASDAPMALRPYFETIDSLETASFPLYIEQPRPVCEIELCFINGVGDLPYISIDTAVQILRQIAAYEHYDGYELTLESAEKSFFLTRETGAFAWFDFNENTITLNDPDLFARHPGAVNSLDVVETLPANEDGEVELFRATGSFYRAGDALTYSLNDYDIIPVYQNGMGYLPLQTFSDVLLSLFPLFALYNGSCVIVASGLLGDNYQPSELGEIYYEGERHLKSEELTLFTYYELCMALDYTYGLMEEHEISSFRSLFAKTGLVKNLLSTEAGDVYAALSDLTCGYFSDFHSAPQSKSFMASEESGMGDPMMLGSMMTMMLSQLPYANARSLYYPDGPAGYEEFGNTAFITFDSFRFNSERDYYNTEITNNAGDVVELLIYANRQIKREDSPIENIVLDLSLNGGGAVPAAMFVVSWFLGSSGFSLVNVKTGARGSVTYQFDADLDHTISAGDSLNDLFGTRHLYCLTGVSSFSCANLVPAALKASGFVTMIGRTSGGGACSVCVMSTADGNVFQLSSPLRASVIKNGTFYSVDEGVEPDIYIDKLEHLYDRQYLTNLINNLD